MGKNYYNYISVRVTLFKIYFMAVTDTISFKIINLYAVWDVGLWNSNMAKFEVTVSKAALLRIVQLWQCDL